MRYYDIHTHQLPVHPEDTAIVNEIVGIGRDSACLEIERTGRKEGLLFRSYGIHPWHIYDVKDQMDELGRLASAPDVVAIGEAGLDKMAATPLAEQVSVFMGQVNLSEELGKPLVIHCVKAWPELMGCRKEARPRQPWIIHGFRGNGELAAQLVRQGFFLSFGERFQSSAVCIAWPSALFAETDDKPIDIRRIYQNISLSLSIPLLDLVDQIGQNVSIFSINR